MASKPTRKALEEALEAARAEAEALKATRAEREAAGKQRKLEAGKRVALVLGCVASGLVVLSVWHLTAALTVLTGSPLALALLLALGIDVGLVSSEVAELVGHGEQAVQRWCRTYMTMATAMSMILNAFEFARHAPEAWFPQALSIGFGVLLPAMIFVLARQATHLWAQK